MRVTAGRANLMPYGKDNKSKQAGFQRRHDINPFSRIEKRGSVTPKYAKCKDELRGIHLQEEVDAS